MDSILTKISNVPQTSAHDKIDFTSGTWNTATYYRPVYIPIGARVSNAFCVLHDTAGGTTGVNTFTVGHLGGALQAGAPLANEAGGGTAADPDAYLTAVDLEGAQTTYSAMGGTAAADYAGVALMGKPPTSTSMAEYSKSGASGDTFTLAPAGEKMVPVIGHLTLGQTQTAGVLFWWIEYRFDANISWEQSAL